MIFRHFGKRCTYFYQAVIKFKYMYITKNLLGSMFIMLAVFGGMLTTPVLAYTGSTTGTYLAPAAKEALIQTLLAQVKLLQAQLVELQKAEAMRAQQGTEDNRKPFAEAMREQHEIKDNRKLFPSAVTAADYTKGSLTAPIQIVTYTDLDCPFCKMFHTTLSSIAKNYPDVAITYRHFPLEQLHPNAVGLAIAAECVGSLAGDAAFWKFIDGLFASREINKQTDMAQIPSLALQAGVSNSALTQCRQSEGARRAVEADSAEGVKSGVQGTPMSFVFYNGQVGEINGAQPLLVVEKTLNLLLD